VTLGAAGESCGPLLRTFFAICLGVADVALCGVDVELDVVSSCT